MRERNSDRVEGLESLLGSWLQSRVGLFRARKHLTHTNTHPRPSYAAECAFVPLLRCQHDVIVKLVA